VGLSQSGTFSAHRGPRADTRRQWLVRMNVAPIRGNDDETGEVRLASRTKGQVGCAATKGLSNPVESPEVKPRCPSILPFCLLHMASNSYVHCLSVCPARPVRCLSSLLLPEAALHSPNRFPKLTPLPHSQRSTNPKLLNAVNVSALSGLNKLLPALLPLENSGSDHGSENHTIFQNPIHYQPQSISLLSYPSSIFHPLLLPTDPHTTAFPQASPVVYNLNTHWFAA
jgi:hypothetical protein